MNIAVIGIGQIGKAISELIDYQEDFNLYQFDIKWDHWETEPVHLDVIHICFPFLEQVNFHKTVVGYLDDLSNNCIDGPKWVIIHSTIPPGTTEKIQKRCPFFNLIHIPLRGTHDSMFSDFATELTKYPLHIGICKPELLGDPSDLRDYLLNIGFLTGPIEKDVKAVELGKLLSTAWYGLNIAFVQEVKRICENNDINFDAAYIRPFMMDKVGRNYRKINGKIQSLQQIDRPVFYPGKIKGHCVMQNLVIMLEERVFDNQEWINFIFKSNNDINLKKLEDE